ncbi:MAG: hypothetical protein ACHQUB_01420 [Candidatus Saccharimonadia bacterium]
MTTTRTHARKTRVVSHQIDAGNYADCEACGEPVKFIARQHPRRIIVNLYKKGVWQAVLNYHPECYEGAGNPHGEISEEAPPTYEKRSNEHISSAKAHGRSGGKRARR